MKNTTQRVVMAALLAALTCVATMLIRIPSPFKGYINLGDCVVLLCGFLLSPMYGFLAAGIGSALADLFSGYVIYAPVTFALKGAMALVAYYGFMILSKRLKPLQSRICSGVVAELLMVAGYFIFEGFLYGFVPSAVNILPNAVQGAVGLILGILLVRVFEKSKIKPN